MDSSPQKVDLTFRGWTRVEQIHTLGCHEMQLWALGMNALRLLLFARLVYFPCNRTQPKSSQIIRKQDPYHQTTHHSSTCVGPVDRFNGPVRVRIHRARRVRASACGARAATTPRTSSSQRGARSAGCNGWGGEVQPGGRCGVRKRWVCHGTPRCI